MIEALAIVIGYLIGSIPTAYIVTRLVRGADIRRLGGGNMGALNAARELGPVWGAVVLLLDVAKGAAVILVAKALGVGTIWVLAAGLAAIVGHCWPVFLNFRGGKGAATTIGVFLALAPLEFVCCLPVIILIIFLTSNVSLGMTAGLILFPLFLWVFGQPLDLIVYAIVVALFLLVRYLPTARRSLTRAGNARDFIFEKKYKPWQSKKKNN